MGYEAYAATRYTTACVSCGKCGAAAKRNDLCRKCFSVKPIGSIRLPPVVTPDPLEAEENTAASVELVRKAMKRLTYAEKEVIKLRMGIGSLYARPYTLKEVGRVFKVSIERVRQLEAKGKSKIQEFVLNQNPDYRL